jgi:hypothetical protein
MINYLDQVTQDSFVSILKFLQNTVFPSSLHNSFFIFLLLSKITEDLLVLFSYVTLTVWNTVIG